jgi:methylmalonyl-CoA/ethylmalonyl-CoA epimerase
MTQFTFHHVGVVTPSLEGAVLTYASLGYSASPQYDDPLQKVSIVLMRRSDGPLMELISPTHADSPAAGWRKRIKAGPYHTCSAVPSLHDAAADLRARDFTSLTEPLPAIAFEMRLVVFLWSATTGLIELVEGP